MLSKKLLLNNLPNGSVVKYRNKTYWLSNGLEDRILTDSDGHWDFIRNKKWKIFKIILLAK
jgi:hypothetical protein